MADEPTTSMQLLRQDHETFKKMAEQRFTSIDRKFENLDTAINDLRGYMTSLGERVEDRMGELRDSLHNIENNSLQSIPPWAVSASDRKSTIITVLTAITCTALAALFMVLVRHL